MNKIYNGIIGLMVGDALGVPVEFKRRGSFTVTDMTGYGTYNQPPGTWSDDSSMTIATLDSLTRLRRVDLADIMENFRKWLTDGEFTPYGEVFDVGGTTRKAIQRYMRGVPLDRCGGRSVMDNGNGALMRILPLPLVRATWEETDKVARLTHAHDLSTAACMIYAAVVQSVFCGMNKGEVETNLTWNKYVLAMPEFSRLSHIKRLFRDEIKSSGYVVDTLEAALWCFLRTDSYAECVLSAVNLGEDTDTVAAVAGGLAGVYYGVGGARGIPQRWIEQIPGEGFVKHCCERLVQK